MGGDLSALTGDNIEAWKLVEKVDKVFLGFGAPHEVMLSEGPDIEELKRRAASVGARFIEIKQRHIGSDNAPAVIGRFKQDLINKGVDFMLETEVKDLLIEEGASKGVILFSGQLIPAHYVLLSPGRRGCNWVSEMIEKHGIKARYGGIDIGVRVEIPAIVMDPVTKFNRDPKFHIQTRRYVQPGAAPSYLSNVMLESALNFRPPSPPIVIILMRRRRSQIQPVSGPRGLDMTRCPTSLKSSGRTSAKRSFTKSSPRLARTESATPDRSSRRQEIARRNWLSFNTLIVRPCAPRHGGTSFRLQP